MSTIGQQLTAAYNSASAYLGNAYGSAKETATEAGAKAKAAGKAAGAFALNTEAQREGFGKVGDGVSKLYEEVAYNANMANWRLETKGEETLRTPIKRMQDYKASPIEIKNTDSSTTQFAKKVANKVKDYHQVITVKGEEYSRIAGDKAHALTSLALYPIRFVAKLLQVEIAGKLIQNSIALAVGFAVRGLVLAMTQLAHLAPYAAAGAVVAGIGAGLVALAKVSLPAAIAAGIGLLLVGQQAQMYSLGKDVHSLSVGISTAKEAKVDAKAKAEAEAKAEAQVKEAAVLTIQKKVRVSLAADQLKAEADVEADVEVEAETASPGLWRQLFG